MSLNLREEKSIFLPKIKSSGPTRWDYHERRNVLTQETEISEQQNTFKSNFKQKYEPHTQIGWELLVLGNLA